MVVLRAVLLLEKTAQKVNADWWLLDFGDYFLGFLDVFKHSEVLSVELFPPFASFSLTSYVINYLRHLLLFLLWVFVLRIHDHLWNVCLHNLIKSSTLFLRFYLRIIFYVFSLDFDNWEGTVNSSYYLAKWGGMWLYLGVLLKPGIYRL